MTTIYYVAGWISGACIHRERGNDGKLWEWLSDRYPAALQMAGTMLFWARDPWSALIVLLGYFFYIVFGWGSYFTSPSHFNAPELVGPREPEIPWIDWLIAKLPRYIILQNFVGMFLRSLFFIPMYAALAWHHHTWWPILNGIYLSALIAGGYTFFPWLAHITKWKFDCTAAAEGWAGGWIVDFQFLTATFGFTA